MIASRLLAEGAEVHCWDPLARITDATPWSATTRHDTALQALAGADAAMVVTEWPELADLPWEDVVHMMRRPVLFDGRNLLDPTRMRDAGFNYLSVGRP
ncbi:UDP binding domain-containing protein [Kitasatospora sp. NPDC052896]|uniref:UDP binding domain-containing protein n=1 Tax=Kitasatospora sp. NPDC052896 TaxID=3364061 RepID=UPI0037C6F0EC